MNIINPCGNDYFLNDNICYKKCSNEYIFDIFNKKCIKEMNYTKINANELCKSDYKFNKYNNKCEKTDVIIPDNFLYVYNSYGYLPPPKIINNKVALLFGSCPNNGKLVSYYCYDICKDGYTRYGDKCYFSKL
jgi:hypothetical protein